MRFLLDTNIVSDLIRNPQGRIAERIREVGEDNICTSIVVGAELRYGAAKEASPKLTARVEDVLAVIDTWLSTRLPMRSTGQSAHSLNWPAPRSVATTLSLQLRRRRLTSSSSPATSRSSRGSRDCASRIGCENRVGL